MNPIKPIKTGPVFDEARTPLNADLGPGRD